MSADRMVGGASAQKNNAVPLRKNQRKSLENSCRNTKNRLANPGSGALPNHNRQESCASMGTTLVFNICDQFFKPDRLALFLKRSECACQFWKLFAVSEKYQHVGP